MIETATFTITIYLVGVLIGLVRIDGRPIVRVGLALLWPVGPIAFVVTLIALVGASIVPLSRVVFRDP
jgi:hypothetical protein